MVLITGASQGIGAACVLSFRDRGASLALTARNATNLRNVAHGEELIIPADLTRAEDRRRMVESTIERYGRLDILINNVGVGLYGDTWETPVEQARALFELNFFAPLDLVRLAVPAMSRNGSGCIVNVGSIAGRITLPWLTLYSASKFALGSLTEGLRMELKHKGIHAITVCPGYVKTGFQQHVLAGEAPQSVRDNRRFAITAAQCAESIARGVERDARTVMAPRIGWLLVALARVAPGFTESRLEQIYRRTPEPATQP